ncbi:60Kd inner membrane protein-domain-containing protein [Aspergillus crustosus]
MWAVRGVPRFTPFQQVRRFHQTRPAPFINEVLDVSTGFIQGVHSVSHLPWVLSLPLTALIVRMGVALPLQVFTKVQARKDSDLTPLVLAWRQHYQRNIGRGSSGGTASALHAKRLITEQVAEQHRALRRRWGVVPFWRPLNFVQMPIWIAIMESIRAMSGNDKGLVPYLRSLFSSSAPDPTAVQLAIEPSLATEGALWFPDLLAGDSTGILPVLLTVSILVNVRSGWKVPTMESIADLPRVEMAKKLSNIGLRTFIQVLALNVGIYSYLYQMPTALMVYWLTSTNVATLQSFVVQKYMFPTPSLKVWRPIYIGYSQPIAKA